MMLGERFGYAGDLPAPWRGHFHGLYFSAFGGDLQQGSAHRTFDQTVIIVVRIVHLKAVTAANAIDFHGTSLANSPTLERRRSSIGK
jgi:hypothetical protein